MRKTTRSSILGVLLALVISAGVLFAAPTLAQDVDLDAFGETAGFATDVDLVETIARLIRVVIGFLGVIAVILVLYGGFVWMTAGGNEDRVKKAKRILTNATIGLVIVVSSFAIASFVLNALVGATGSGSSSGSGGSGSGGYGDGGSSSVFYLTSVNNECAESLMNLELQFVFSQSVDSDTVESGITISETGVGEVDGTYSTSGRRVTFTPAELCDGYDDVYCFDSGTTYDIVVEAGILESTGGRSLTCTTDYPCSFSFTTGSEVDTESPTVEMDAPEDGQSVYLGDIELMQALTVDDSGVSSVDFFLIDDDEAIFAAGSSSSTAGSILGGGEENYFYSDVTDEWDTSGYTTNEEYDIWAKGYDCAGNADTASRVSVVLRAANCNNGVQDEDLGETDVDCGGEDTDSIYYCGSCDGDACSSDSDCSSGQCVDGVCETTPKIERITPGDGAPSNLVTIAGEGFGTDGGTITFLGSEDGSEVEVSAYACNETTQWSDDEIIVQVPDAAVDGPIAITTSEEEQERSDDSYGPSISDFDVNAIERPGICLLDPDSASYEDAVEVYGVSFGDAQDSSTFYFSNYESASYPTWGADQLQVVVPNINARDYYAQVFTGDYVCIDVSGNATGATCSSDDDCDTESDESCADKWCSESLEYCTEDADCEDGEGTCESIRVGSNEVSFSVEGVSSDTVPTISSIDSGWYACSGGSDDGEYCGSDDDCENTCESASNWGPADQYVTIYGTNFGSAEGFVVFEGEEYTANGDADFPDVCGEDYWSDTQITIKVPRLYQTEEETLIEAGTHNLYIQRQDGVSSDASDFVVIEGTPGPAICNIDPSSGIPGLTEVQIYGENFGEDDGSVEFYEEEEASYTSWSNNEVATVVIPEDAQTGPVYVIEAERGYSSNSVTFSVGDCRLDDSICGTGEECCSNGTCSTSCEDTNVESHYAFKFTTGITPQVPEVLVECSDDRLSPTPWEGWSDAEDICLNASIEAEFSLTMDPSSITTSSVTVEKCTETYSEEDEDDGLGDEGDCATWEEVEAGSGYPDADTTGFTWEPDGDLEADTTYRVTLAGGGDVGDIRADDVDGGAYLQADYQWEFTTTSSGTYCEVGDVNVRPAEYTATEQDDYEYSAQLIAANDNCVSLSCDGYTTYWDSSEEDRAIIFTAEPGVGVCSNDVYAFAETLYEVPALINVEVTNAESRPNDDGELTINFLDPQVDEIFPSCTTACVNALPWVTFNTTMDPDTISVDAGTITMYECEDYLCDPDDTGTTEVSFIESIEFTSGDELMEINFATGEEMEPNTWYRIVLDGEGITSSTGVALSEAGSNFSSDENRYFENDYSWTFKTKDDDVSCRPDSVRVSPSEAIMSYIGERQEFHATPIGEPDDCSSAGQALQSGDFEWSAWSATDADNVIDPESGDESSQDNIVAYMVLDGAISITEELPSYCTSSCLNAGATITAADGICGNGVVETYEECDDGATEDGDGCSAKCLMEGDSGTCGDAILDSSQEQCDDGNTEDGDGCSAQCLNEGSRAIGSTCGDGTVDHSASTGGEDCDDGNAVSGDGCSRNCLNEGTTEFSTTLAVCGNGTIEDGEDCDTGDYTDTTDGCSEQCLNEGTVACGTSTTNCCGNGTIDAGEECETTDEGCDTSSCLWAGSSVSYSTPSFCGDADATGIGEECDATSTSDSSDFGVSQIATGASVEVDKDTGYAISTIAITVDTDITGTADLALECACTTDNSCGVSGVGCGTNNCCYERPELDTSAIQPEDNTSTESYSLGGGHCRNVAVAVAFTDWMDQSSFDQTQDLDETGDSGFGTIEEDEVEANLFLDLVSIEGTEVTATTCPASYTGVTLSQVDHSVFARVWHWMKRAVFGLFGQEVTASDTYLCYVPLAYEVSETEDDGMHVYLRYTELLEANAEYRLMVVADDDGSDEEKDGIVSADGVTLCLGTSCGDDEYEHSFYVGEDICTLDRVLVEDNGDVDAEEYDSLSIQYFSSTGEEHEFEATPQTLRSSGGYQEISPVTDIYDWSWEWDSSNDDSEEGDVIAVEEETEYDTVTNYTASGNSGDELVLATATILNDTITGEESAGDTTTGDLDVQALVCENPWPELDSSLGFPYVETDESTNFSFFYCRDDGSDGTDDDLPGLEDPIDVTSIDSDILQELIFQVEDTSDAIGVRVLKNEEYLSPEAWVEAQEFTGNFSASTVDGYQAVEAGTTVYVAAANVNDGDIYPNIYVISYNEDAGEEANEIFDRILDEFEFNANTDDVTDINLCYDTRNEAYVTDADGEYVECAWDGICLEACEDETCSQTDMSFIRCDADKASLQRDMQRLTDVTDMVATLDTYGDNNGRCSVTTGQSCDTDSDCPGTETCEASYPQVVSGTFVPSMSVSAWGSWNAALANEIETTLATDPINEFYNCSEDGYDEASCWNGEAGAFQCPDRSHVYGYKTLGGDSYTLYAQLESSLLSAWAYDIDSSSSDDVTIQVEYPDGYNPDRNGTVTQNSGFQTSAEFCDGDTIGNSEICGDGVIGVNEDCEVGDTTSIACTDDATGDPGMITALCITGTGSETVDCRSGYQSESEAEADGAECVAYSCGNGVIESGEDCDDGSLNGTYGFCDDNCSYSDAFYCGDGYLAGTEVCDCGTVATHTDVMADSSSWASANCSVANGLYSTNIDDSCAYDCTTPGLACGDGVVNGSEECDGDYEEWEGATCSDGTTCTSDSDCDSGSCGDGASACGISSVCQEFSTAGDECDSADDCLDDQGYGGYCDSGYCSSSRFAGDTCSDDTDCSSSYSPYDAQCSTATYQTFHYRTCDGNCGWDSWSDCTGGTQICGNGILEGTEECDDGNSSNHDACTNSCIANVCGDDYVNVGIESCDDGDENGDECDAAYGGTCNFCNSACQYKTKTGGFCGDGEVDDLHEVCDGGYSTQMKYVDLYSPESASGVCGPDEYMTQNTDGEYCLWVGVCNGGTNNGTNCVVNYGDYRDHGTLAEDEGVTSCEAGGGTCQPPICADDCGSSCPSTYETTGLQVQSEIGTTRVDSIDLYSYQNDEGDSPDSGVMYIPACNVATKITADVDDSDRTLPDVDVVFVTDFSGSMDNQPDGSTGSSSLGNRRIDYVAEAAEEAIGELFDAFSGSGADVRIALMSYTTGHLGGSPQCQGTLVNTYLQDGAAVDSIGLLDEGNESYLVSQVQKYPTCVSGGTPTYAGMQAAASYLNSASSAEVQIVVLLTDGEPTYNANFYDSGSADDCGSYSAKTFANPIGRHSGTDRCVAELYSDIVRNYTGVTFYTATVNDDPDLQGYMAHASSNECQWNDIEDADDCEGGYAYTATTAEEILEMYDAIVDSIIGTTLFENATNDAGELTVTSGSVVGGDNIELPFPEGFVCKSTEQEIPIRHTMYGEGYLEFSDFNITYCPYQ